MLEKFYCGFLVLISINTSKLWLFNRLVSVAPGVKIAVMVVCDKNFHFCANFTACKIPSAALVCV